MIATPGAVDTHVHLLSPRICEAALAAASRRCSGRSSGRSGAPASTRLGAADGVPRVRRLAGEHRVPRPRVVVPPGAAAGGARGRRLRVQGARGLRGAPPRARHGAARGRRPRRPGRLHTDGLNEYLALEDTLAVIGGRTVHAYHVEGCGGGHVPDVLELAGVPNVIGSSTNPTLPFARDAVAEHQAMIMLGPRARPARPSEQHGPRPGPRRDDGAPRPCCTTWA